MKIFIIAVAFLFLSVTLHAETVDVVIHWTSDDIVQDRDDAALDLNYQDEIEDLDNPGEMIPNPISKKQTVINELVKNLQKIIISGAAKRADSHRIDAVNEATTRVQGITGE